MACSLVGLRKLSHLCGQALATCQVTAPRPPPLPDPETEYKSRQALRASRKDFLDLLRSSHTEHRLLKRSSGQAQKQLNKLQRLHFSLASSILCPAIVSLILHWADQTAWYIQLAALCVFSLGVKTWLSSLGTLWLELLDYGTVTQSGGVSSSESILGALTTDLDVIVSLFRLVLMNLVQVLIFSVIDGLGPSLVELVHSGVGLDVQSSTVLVVWIGDAVQSFLTVRTSWVNLLLFGLSLSDLSTENDVSTMCLSTGVAWCASVHLVPPIPSLLQFLWSDIPHTWNDSPTWMSDLESIACDQETEWSIEVDEPYSFAMQLLPSTEEWPLASWVDTMSPSISVCFVGKPLSWRRRRCLKRWFDGVSSDMPTSLAEPTESPIIPDDLRQQILISSWTRQMNPAIEGKKWLAAEHMDKVVFQRPSRRKKKRVSINLSTGRSSTPPAIYLQTIETVFNTLTKNRSIPLIVDSGASCCVSPRREDFITYNKSSVRIKDLSGCNKVAGEGMISWKVLDKFGREYEIQLKGYHMPRAAVRLLSPQCVTQAFKGSYGGQSHSQYILRFPDKTIIEAPYNQANLPELTLSSADAPVCLWSRCFVFSSTGTEVWADNVLAEKNKNLTPAQKELLRWHQRLSHAGLSTIHNLCRQKRSGRVDSTSDLVAIRDGAQLPCTFNVPSATCDGLLCAACETAKASRRAPSMRPTCKPASRKMLLKQNDLQPGDCISCDHFLSPVKGRTISSSGYSSSSQGVSCGTLYVDHATGWIFAKQQKNRNVEMSIRRCNNQQPICIEYQIYHTVVSTSTKYGISSCQLCP